ncbi:YraN family protein [Helicobacter sp.]|uniref:YraN family protein n=1 Tax=Helicobacter sp. TaxID=218 RepID=UPI0025B97081|nr:YraN family protein [Helicobacter sp.]MCI5969223.1 YraN family protein [Helicobacter sp.]MDY2585478.1 YraN family protein [Helicobacter sp.]
MKNKDTINTTQKGKEAESFACAFLESEGYAILECNFSTRFGEIDIIARKNGVLHFIEVKSGIGFEPIYNISPKKLKRLTKTIHIYLSNNPLRLPYCLSAILLSKDAFNDSFCVEWIENLTLF